MGMAHLPKLQLRPLALAALLALGCAPWWPERSVPYAAMTRADAVACVEATLRDQRYRTGEKWEVFGHDPDRFARWRHQYPTRQRQEPSYLGTYDELTIDALADGTLRIDARGWHLHATPSKGFHEVQKAPGPAAHHAADAIEKECAP